MQPSRRACASSASEPLTVVISTHDRELAHELAIVIWVLESGKLETRTGSEAPGRCQHDAPATQRTAGT
ncbi:MAG TPA: hypothetical protein VNN80_15545 [Polyangiaceae bacterium]|nr:hypothetical protein [Polyangiaceae bacterium]